MMNQYPKIIKAKGITLLEMVIAVTIVGILTSMASPSMKAMIENNRVAVANNNLVSALFFARSEALKRRVSVYLCISNVTQTECETNTANMDYANGWLVYMDCNGDGYSGDTKTCDFVPDSADTADTKELLNVGQSIDGGLETSGTFTGLIGFNLSGRAITTGTVCLENSGTKKNKISVAASGRVSSEEVSTCS